MDISKYFSNLELSGSQRLAIAKLEHFIKSDLQVFILKGYAGTGKTTLLRGVIDYLKDLEKTVEVVAPTGRAAKVLQDKTTHGMTIHRGIYDLQRLESINAESTDDAEKSFHFYFPIATNSVRNRVIIVDEASMISNKPSRHELFTFGTGKLLTDLLSYSKISLTSNKIIFVGDPAQLPPVTDALSQALDGNFFTSNQIRFDEITLTDVFRQGEKGALILQNATKIRQLLADEIRNTLSFKYDETSFTNLQSVDAPSLYAEKFPVAKVGNGVIIAYTNFQTAANNQAIREKIFPGAKDVTVGDIIILNNNNYHTYGVQLFNGDMAQVVAVSKTTEKQSAPVYVQEGSKKVKKVYTLDFRDVTLRFPNIQEEIKCKIIDSFLNGTSGSLSVEEMKALYINFVIRFRSRQKSREAQGERTYKEGSNEFKDDLRSDPYFNALKVKYAYSVTCHKAQGGEWDEVFVDFRQRIGLNDSALRWMYTAITRAKSHCLCISPPNLDVFEGLKIRETNYANNWPRDFFSFSTPPTTPFHSQNSHPCKKMKFHAVVRLLEGTAFSVESVESQPYRETYHIIFDNHPYIISGTHNAAGDFDSFTCSSQNATAQKVLTFFNSYYKPDIDILYVPSADSFDKLFSKILSIIVEIDALVLTNVVEHRPNHYVDYYLQSAHGNGRLQIYFDKNLKFTLVQPYLIECDSFPEMDELLSKLSA
jgi:hypothetical protein